jgi:hypothetical protein
MFIGKQEFFFYKNTKKVICFGAGEIALKMFNIVGDFFHYYIDNDKNKHNTLFYNKKIYKPNILLKENPDQIFIVISIEDYQSAKSQLEDMGFLFGINFGYSVLLKNYAAYELLDLGSTKLLISCYNGNRSGLYIANSRSGKCELLYEGRFHGICTTKDKIYVVNRTEGIWCLNKNTLEIIDKYTITGLFLPCGITFNSQKNIFYLVETGRDRILTISGETFKVISTHDFSELFSIRKVEQHHINDIIVVDDSIWLSMFSLSGKWRYNIFDGSIGEYDFNFKFKNLLVNNALKPHSLIVKEHSLYYLDSFTGTLKIGNGKDIAFFPGFVRGLEKDQSRFYIGLSRHRHIEDIFNKNFPKLTNSGIFVYSSEHNAYKFIPLENVYDVYGIKDLSNDGI